MTPEREPEKLSFAQRLSRLPIFNIRGKIVLPYLILTIVVAIAGTYVVLQLVDSSLEERLNNALVEAGSVVSDSLVRQEVDHIESARSVAYTMGLGQAVESGDRERVTELAVPAIAVRGIESLMVFDRNGHELLNALQQIDGSYVRVEIQTNASALWMVQAVLESGDPNALPERGLGLHTADQRYYHFTAVPISLDEKAAGVVVVGTSLNTLLPYYKTNSLADVIVYGEGGRALATTFSVADQPTGFVPTLDQLSITPELYNQLLNSSGTTLGENIELYKRSYRLARNPLRVGDDTLGVFAVALPADFVTEARTTSRNTWLLIFGVAMVGVVLVGYFISQRITVPLSRLVRTSRAVAEGHLDRRTGIASSDEIGFLATTFDEMTGRLEERTKALEEALGRLRAILSSMGDGVLLEDLEGKFIPLNAAAEVLLYEMSDDFLLGPLREMSVEPSDITDLRPSPWLLERRRFEVGRKVVSVHSAAVRTEDGEHLGSVIVLRDVTAEAEAERLKDAFVTHVSHELRTPLTAIKGYSSLLLSNTREILNEAQQGFLRTITKHTDNLVEMINALLDFSEMEAGGRLGLQRSPVLLSKLIEEIAQEWQAQMDDRGLDLQIEVPEDLPTVDVDTRRMRWAVINLVRNAWQNTPEGGSVTLRLQADDSQVTLDVVDTGVGIPTEEQDKLFTRFYRVTRETGDDVRGMGIGLYVTKAIVEAHGGEVRVASKEGTGSTFSVVLPTSQDTPEDSE